MAFNGDAVTQGGVWRIPASRNAIIDSTIKAVPKFVIINGNWND